ncbi:MAG: alpha/beta hydrolase [Chloroflexota bacterium]
MPQPLIELGGNDNTPILSLAPANGFVPQTYIPLLRPFMESYKVVSTPPRALWNEGAPPSLDANHSWEDFAKDMLVAYETFGLQDVVAVGHSIGGIMTILAALERPEIFKAIIMLDPVIVPPEACAYMEQQRAQGKPAHNKMAERASKRKRAFASVDDAFDNFHGKSIFADWSDEVLRLYVEHGTQPCGDERCLTWSPEWEAFYFSTYYTQIWEALVKLPALDVPMLFISGGDSDTFTPESARKVAELVTNATHDSVLGYGHMFPQAAPQQTADRIQKWLDSVLV